jgi:hypothetical protein
MSQLVNWTVEETCGGLKKVRKVEQLFSVTLALPSAKTTDAINLHKLKYAHIKLICTNYNFH